MRKLLVFALAAILLAGIVLPVSAQTLVDGNWSIDQAAKTLTWTGTKDGSTDIAQGEIALGALKSGYVATFETTVVGRLVIVTGMVDDTKVDAPIDALQPGVHTVTSTGPSAGFRWQVAKVVAAGGHQCPPEDGICWNISDNTMTWYGQQDGSVDIHQGDATSLAAIRGGTTAVFNYTVPCTLIITSGVVNGTPVSGNQNLTAGAYQITSPGQSGGFRVTPINGQGWRK